MVFILVNFNWTFSGFGISNIMSVRTKGLGNAHVKHHRRRRRRRRVRLNSIEHVSDTSIRRLARRAGVKRISGLTYTHTRQVLKIFLESVIHDAIAYTTHNKSDTITLKAVLYALKRRGYTMFVFPE